MTCVWCSEEIVTSLHWENLLFGKVQRKLCSVCEEKLEPIRNPRCWKCSRASKEPICTDCQWWDTYFGGSDPLAENYSVFNYNEMMQEIIAKWKYRGDYILGTMFQELFRRSFNDNYRKKL